VDEFTKITSNIDAELIQDTLHRRKAFSTLQNLKEQVTKIKSKPVEQTTLHKKENEELVSEMSEDEDDIVDWRSKGF